MTCLPSFIPERIDIDVTPLRIHGVLTVADLQLPEGVRVTVATTQAIVTVTPPMAEEVAPVVAAPAAEPEVVTERKPKEEEEVKPEGKAKK